MYRENRMKHANTLFRQRVETSGPKLSLLRVTAVRELASPRFAAYKQIGVGIPFIGESCLPNLSPNLLLLDLFFTCGHSVSGRSVPRGTGTEGRCFRTRLLNTEVPQDEWDIVL
jgi:hypothetical protein